MPGAGEVTISAFAFSRVGRLVAAAGLEGGLRRREGCVVIDRPPCAANNVSQGVPLLHKDGGLTLHKLNMIASQHAARNNRERRLNLTCPPRLSSMQ